MHIKKILIENFKCFNVKFLLEFNKTLNILVGDNETGKSTILEAIHLALSGWISGRHITYELTQSLFNKTVIDLFLQSIRDHNPIPPPEILIELFFEIEDDSLRAIFEGNGNSLREKNCGIQFKISFNDKFKNEYEILLDNGDDITSLPIEYYDFSWTSFARDDGLTPKSIPIKSALIDSFNSRYQNGTDVYISRIIKDDLSDEHKVKLSQAHRKLKDSFAQNSAIKEINEMLQQKKISEKRIEISIEMSTKSAWETNITTYLDDIPFGYIGRGEQSLVKTKLALSHKKSQEANVLLLEEPENHLSHAKLNRFIKYMKDNMGDKQLLVSTHSSFVANKLGLGNLILLSVDGITRQRNQSKMSDLQNETKKYFEKLPGFDTLRLILCKKAILVEGPSDELILQKAFLKIHSKLPIEDEIDVISVGTAFLRFLELAEKLKVPVVVVTDNDGDIEALKTKYENYLADNKKSFIEICYDEEIDAGELEGFNYNTLEPKLVKSNSLELFNEIFNKHFDTLSKLHLYMKDQKTECALKIFESDREIQFPVYIINAIKWEYVQE